MSTDILFWIGGALLGLIGLTLLTWALIGDRSKGRRRCPRCWYDMSKTAGLRCSECGREARSERKLFKSRRRWRWAMASVLLFAFAAYVAVQPKVKHDGWASVMPNTVLIFALRSEHASSAIGELLKRAHRVTGKQSETLDDGMWQWQWKACAEHCMRFMDSSSAALNDRACALSLFNACLAAVKSESARDELFELMEPTLQDNVTQIKLHAIAIATKDPRIERSRRRILRVINDQDPQFRLAGVVCLASLAPGDADNAPSATMFLRMMSIIHGSEPFRDGHFHNDDRTPLLEVVQSDLKDVFHNGDDPLVRGMALVVMCDGTVLTKEAATLVEEALQDSTDEVVAAGLYVSRYQRPVSKLVLQRTMVGLNSSTPVLRDCAAQYLRQIDAEYLVDRVDELERIAYTSDDIDVRQAVTLKLERIYRVMRDQGEEVFSRDFDRFKTEPAETENEP